MRRNRPGGVPGVGATHGAGGIAPGVGAAPPRLPQGWWCGPQCPKLPQSARKCSSDLRERIPAGSQ